MVPCGNRLIRCTDLHKLA